MSKSPFRVTEIVIRTGMIGGLVAGCLGTVQFGLASLALVNLDAGTRRNLDDASTLASFAIFFLVGCLVRRWTGSVEAATRAGFVAAVIACLLSCLAVVVLGAFLPNVYAPDTAQTAPGIDGGSAGTSVLVALGTLVILAAAGFGLAMAGALAQRPRTASDRVHRYR
ncbi:MAG TPA: hypothetical protein VGP82_13670 [Ktedonobacterales bacterium]|jgi:hypothetical protein|nr:hypothetical protein [Ktedonobacterales bacterium]